MKLLFVLLLLSTSAFGAFEKSFDHKTGFMFGLGANMTSYKFPSRFTGNTKKRIDSSHRMIGPEFHLGYDVVAFKKILLGVRGETWMADNLNMGNTENGDLKETTSGKASALNVTGRLGIPFHVNMIDLLGLTNRFVLEVFGEVGGGKYWAQMDKSYTFKKTPTESYSDKVRDQRLTAIVAGGFNIASYSGAFFEIKFMQTRTISNKVDYLKGSETTNGGASTVLPAQMKKNFNDGVISSLVFSFGYHW